MAGRHGATRLKAGPRGKGLRACVADLAGEDGVPGAELTGCVLEAELAREGEEPPDALLGT